MALFFLAPGVGELVAKFLELGATVMKMITGVYDMINKIIEYTKERIEIFNEGSIK
jgi:hypothetical protein